jgi:hypothetical protein
MTSNTSRHASELVHGLAPNADGLVDVLAGLRPTVRSGAFVVVSLPTRSDVPVEAVIHEDDGVTHVVARDVAKAEGWAHDFVAGWITLGVQTDLALVGLTAVVATALAEHGISCNVLAGHRHDHLLVPLDRLDDALLVLDGLSRDARELRARRTT